MRYTKVADEELDPNRHEVFVEDEIKVYIMTKQPLPKEEITTKSESLCLVKGFQSYCIYELDHSAFPEDKSLFYSCIIELYIQSFFKDSVVEEIRASGHFNDWELTIHQDAVRFTM